MLTSRRFLQGKGFHPFAAFHTPVRARLSQRWAGGTFATGSGGTAPAGFLQGETTIGQQLQFFVTSGALHLIETAAADYVSAIRESSSIGNHTEIAPPVPTDFQDEGEGSFVDAYL